MARTSEGLIVEGDRITEIALSYTEGHNVDIRWAYQYGRLANTMYLGSIAKSLHVLAQLAQVNER